MYLFLFYLLASAIAFVLESREDFKRYQRYCETHDGYLWKDDRNERLEKLNSDIKSNTIISLFWPFLGMWYLSRFFDNVFIEQVRKIAEKYYKEEK